MKKPKKALQEKILEELANGELVTVLCRRKDMPTLNTLQRGTRQESEFDDRCWSAEAQAVATAAPSMPKTGISPALSPALIRILKIMSIFCRPGCGWMPLSALSGFAGWRNWQPPPPGQPMLTPCKGRKKKRLKSIRCLHLVLKTTIL